MKFAHQIQFNAVPDWTDYYVPYSKLKKLIYAIEKDDLSLSCNLDEELAATDQTPLIINHSVNNVMEATNHRFLAALNKALKKIIAFYAQKETELYDDMDQLLFDYDRLNTLHSHDPLTLSTEPSAIQHSPEHKRHTTALQKRTVDLFVMLSELQSYVTLNHTAFSKILKKYDKITDNALKPYYLANYVDAAFPFKATTRARLDERIQETQHGYVKLVVTADITKESAMEDLKMHLREHVIWERNTVWRDLVGFERKTQTVVLVAEQRGCQWVNGFFLAAALLVFTVLLYLDLFGGQVEQNRCFAILVFTSLLWVGKIMPLFVTALMVPFLVVTLRVLRSDDGSRLDAPAATRSLFAAMFSPVLMLLVGAFSLAGALSKYGISKTMAGFVLSRSGTRPNRVLLAHMLVATVTSMWTSNVAAPVLSYSLIQPILRTLPGDARFASCLILGIALASTLGGMASPIASPQNIIAMQYMSPAPTWGEWLLVSVPLCVVGDWILWLWLIWSYAPEHQLTHIHPFRSTSHPITWTQIYICLVTVGTILLWCLAPTFDVFFGDMGVVAIVPIAALFGPKILTTDDFNTFAWSVVTLAMGGIALGHAMESSGLTLTLVGGIQQSGSLGLGVLVLVLATLIGPTSTASIMMPIATKMDQSRFLVMGAAFVCSCAMGLPISGFPNMYAVAQENKLGTAYLSTKDFLRNGVPCSALTMLCVTTLGYLLMKGVGF